MPNTDGLSLREATSDDDPVTSKHYYNMWLGMSYPADKLHPDFEQRTVAFITDARRQKDYMSFMAEINGTPVGTVCCQLFGGLYPLVFRESDR